MMLLPNDPNFYENQTNAKKKKSAIKLYETCCAPSKDLVLFASQKLKEKKIGPI